MMFKLENLYKGYKYIFRRRRSSIALSLMKKHKIKPALPNDYSEILNEFGYSALHHSFSEKISIPFPVVNNWKQDWECRRRSSSWVLDIAETGLLPEATIVGRTGLCFVGKEFCLPGSVVPLTYKGAVRAIPDLRDLKLFIKGKAENLRNSKPIVSLIGVWSNSYFHWMTECLPKLSVLELIEPLWRDKVLILVDKRLSDWQTKSLRGLGVKECNIVRWDYGKICVNNLILLPYQRCFCDSSDKFSALVPSGVRWVANSIDAYYGLKRSAKRNDKVVVWVSRRNARGRKLIDEFRLLKALSDKINVASLCCEDLSFEEQLNVYSKAAVIAGPHGAGLTNSMFASDGSGLLEVSRPHLNASFHTLSAAKGGPYAVVYGDACGLMKTQRLKGIRADAGEVRGALEKVLDCVERGI